MSGGQISRAALVRATAGRDKGKLLCVLETDGAFLLLADGKGRRLAAPKRKGRRHVEYLGEPRHPVLERLGKGAPVGDRELRRALAALRDELGG